MSEQEGAHDHLVFVLHGLGRTKISMTPFAWWLRRQGFAALAFGYRSRSYDIPDHVASLRKFVERGVATRGLAHDSAPPRISFVGHSLGSIIAAKLIEGSPHLYRWHSLVMLGPPNRGAQFGSKVATVPILSSILGPALPSILKQNGSYSFPSDLKVGVIAGGRGADRRGFSPLIKGDNDGIVAVAETLCEPLHDHIVVRVPHFALMMSPQVMGLAAEFLRLGRFL